MSVYTYNKNIHNQILRNLFLSPKYYKNISNFHDTKYIKYTITWKLLRLSGPYIYEDSKFRNVNNKYLFKFVNILKIHNKPR